MSNPIRAAGAIAPRSAADPAHGASVRTSGSTFAETLRASDEPAAEGGARRAGGGASEAIRGAVRSLTEGERMVDEVIRSARRGRVFSNEELIAIQAGVYRYTQELELASKLVDKATGAIRQTLQSQQ